MTNRPFPTDAKLTAVAVGYRNTQLIADQVAPRAPVRSESFKWWEYTTDQAFSVPDSAVGRTSRPNEVEFDATEQSASTVDWGLDQPIPKSDLDAAAAIGKDIRPEKVERLTDLIMLGREVRVAGLVFAAGNYPTGNKVQLSSSSDKWSDYTNSDPADDILTGLDACLMRPNVMVLGHTAWDKLRRHPKLVKAITGNDTGEGLLTRQAVASLFELEEVLVGVGRLNSAKKGQAMSLARVWGGHCALIYRNKTFSFDNKDMTFCATAQWGERVAGSMPDANIGLRGGEVVRAGESVKELIVANRAGYFIQDAV